MPVTYAEPVILVPRSSMVSRNRKQVVFVVNGGKAQAVEAQFGLPSGGYLPVQSGLLAGQQLITSPMELISNGTDVVVATSVSAGQ